MNENIGISRHRQMEGVGVCRVCFIRERRMNGREREMRSEAEESKTRKHPKVTRWQAGLLMAAAALQLVSARLSIPVRAVGITGPTQHHVSSPSQARDTISTIAHAALIT